MSSVFAGGGVSLSFTGPTNWAPGTSITLQTNDTFVLESSGLSYWLQVNNAIAPFLTITSLAYNQPFTDPNSYPPFGRLPFSFNSTSGADAGFMTTTTADGFSGDLGATTDPLGPVPGGTYLDITDISFALAANAPGGTYTLRTTTAAPRGSVQVNWISEDSPIPQASFVFNVVPEPSTLALLLAGLGAGVMAYRCRK
jgi:hypothetical protein